MDVRQLGTTGLWVCIVGVVVCAAAAVVDPSAAAKGLGVAGAVLFLIGAGVAYQVSASVGAGRRAMSNALAALKDGGNADFSATAALLGPDGAALGSVVAGGRTDQRAYADGLHALEGAADEVVSRHEKLGQALRSQESARSDQRGAIEEASVEFTHVTEASTSLNRNVVETSAAIEETVSSIRMVSSNIGGLADTVNSVSSAIGELAVSISQVAGNAQEANTLSLQADTKARDGGKAVERLVESTREIANDIGSIVKKMEELGSASAQIGNIVEVIDTIADQTNLLALNAAIEAARAGEHGRGFAVVADEVRKLAENSAASTKEIGHLIKDIQAKTVEVVRSTTESGAKATTGLQMADLAGRAINDILTAVAEASRLIEQISTAAREQAAGSSAIVNSVEMMNQLMREAARSLDEQNTSNAQMLATIASMQRLTDSVSGAVERQRAAFRSIDDAATRLAAAASLSLDASAGIEDAAHALRERARMLAEIDPKNGRSTLERGEMFAQLAGGR